MKVLKIYDPAMCCSSGVCGPSVNDELVQLAAFLKGLDESQCVVERYNLTQDPAAYVSNPEVAKALAEQGTDALPLVFLDDKQVACGAYPSLETLADLLQIGCPGPDAASTVCCSGGGC